MFSVVYHPGAKEEATALPVKIRVKFDRLIGKLEYDARLLREPDSKPLGEGLFEIRTMGTDIARGIWVYHKCNSIIILRVFIKKSQKTPAKEIYPSYLKLLLRWLRSLTRITYQSKLIGIRSLAALRQLQLFWV